MPVSRRCFVISPIGADGSSTRRHADDVFDYIIKPAVEECGLKPFRSDHLHEPGRITEQMFREIVTGDCCVALLTGQNPNVFYELAVAQVVGTPVVALIEKSEATPFDVQDLRCVRYDLSPRPLFDRVYIKELTAHFNRLKSDGFGAQPVFGHLTAQRLARTGLPSSLVTELTSAWPEKRSTLSERQRQLLDAIERSSLEHRGFISQRDLAKITGKPHDDPATYYRLECLRLLGFIEKERDFLDQSFKYRLADGYGIAFAAATE